MFMFAFGGNPPAGFGGAPFSAPPAGGGPKGGFATAGGFACPAETPCANRRERRRRGGHVSTTLHGVSA